MTQNSALKPGRVSLPVVLLLLLILLFPALAACTGTPLRTTGGARHMKRTVQKQNACISGY
ncbi:exported hypothetical protein [Paraburkholderia ribeironis]|uniref:Uncharacterized protein n=1 Tax=Paraburkholderia ribeironis TaxID=1247936 RepID=A0A1N7S0W2_9BURK|nr:exported hypothetical protein [Paraburkholderia ribeironis]